MPHVRLTDLLLRRKSVRCRTDFLDTETPGSFGVTISPDGTKTFFLRYRFGHHQRRLKLGRYPALSLADARSEAKDALALVHRGIDPQRRRREAREARTVRALRDRFMEEHAPKRSADTRRNYALCWNHLKPLFDAPVHDIRWEDLAAVHADLSDRPVMANRVLSLASKAFSLAKRWGWFPRDAANPAREHDRNPEYRRGVALEPQQIRAIGKALEAERAGSTRDALTVTLLTGARPREIYTARWDMLDGRVLQLPRAKTGPRSVYLGAPAFAVLERRARKSDFAFPGRKPGAPLGSLNAIWRRVKARAELPATIRLYDAGRHTFATVAEELGVPEDRRRRIMGHAPRGVHEGYIHPRHSVLLREADRVAEALWAALQGGEETGEIIAFPG